MLFDELGDRGRSLLADPLDDIVCASENSVAVVDDYVAEMLYSVRGEAPPFEDSDEFLVINRVIGDGPAEHLGHDLGDFAMVHFRRPVERVGLAQVWLRVGQDVGDHLRLVARGDGCVAAVPIGRRRVSACATGPAKMVSHSAKKVGRR